MKFFKNKIKPKKRIIYVKTTYGTLEIINLKNVWVNNFLGQWHLMYQDDIYEYNCIYWNMDNPYNLKNIKKNLCKHIIMVILLLNYYNIKMEVPSISIY